MMKINDDGIDVASITKNTWFYLVNSILNCARTNNAALMTSLLHLLDQMLETPGQIEAFIRAMTDFSHVSLNLAGSEQANVAVMKDFSCMELIMIIMDSEWWHSAFHSHHAPSAQPHSHSNYTLHSSLSASCL